MFTTTHDVSTGLTQTVPYTAQEKIQWEKNRTTLLSNAKVLYNEEIKNKRAEAYKAEADFLFLKSQRGEATVEEWQNKVQEIKARFPYQE